MTDATSANQTSANPLQPVLFEVKRTIVGQDVLLERMAVALLSGGHLLWRASPGWPRRCPSSRSPRRSAASSSGSSSRPTWCPPT